MLCKTTTYGSTIRSGLENVEELTKGLFECGECGIDENSNGDFNNHIHIHLWDCVG